MALPPDAKQDAEQRMLGAVPGVPALGRGPAPDGDYSRHEYHHPAAGWGAARKKLLLVGTRVSSSTNRISKFGRRAG